MYVCIDRYVGRGWLEMEIEKDVGKIRGTTHYIHKIEVTYRTYCKTGLCCGELNYMANYVCSSYLRIVHCF
jgi:hypothetical protein